MNKSLTEAMAFASAMAVADKSRDDRIRRFVIPSFTAVREVKKELSGTSVLVGAQNMHWEDQGAWTGEISPLMLVDCGLDIVELGHSERRVHFGETDETVGLKVEAAARHGVIPLICIGETLSDREAGRVQEVLERQVRRALGPLSAMRNHAPVLFAYEPVWAIGEQGVPATSEYANARHVEIAEVAQDVLDRKTPCLYGGSVNADNCVDLIGSSHIDGLFIGRAAWQVEGYLDILEKCAATLGPTKGEQT